MALCIYGTATAQIGGSFSYDTLGRRKEVERVDTRSQQNTSIEPKEKKAKKDKEPGVESRWTFGGSFGMSFGNGEWGLQASPQVGYRVSSMVSVGMGMSYSYFEGRDWGDYQLNYFGLNANIRIYPVQRFLIFAQPEVHRRWGREGRQDIRTETFMCLPLGAGVSVPVGMRGEMTVSLYYDVIQNRYTPYGNRISCSVGYNFRL